MSRPALLLALSACLLAAGCGGAAATPTAPADVSAPAIASAPASPIATPAAASVSTGSGGAALCSFLQAELPALQQAGSTGGAVSVLAIDYANWIAADASRVLPDASALDTLTEAACPETRSAVLKLLGGDSFSVAF